MSRSSMIGMNDIYDVGRFLLTYTLLVVFYTLGGLE